tara:strand:+ start:302 stop:961 length:660 start_codon:yes stop_codon:yes gene_type:complete
MATKKITELTAQITGNLVSANDVLAIVDIANNSTKKITIDTLTSALGDVVADGTLQVSGLAKTTNVSNPTGTVLADDTAAITLVAADHGKIFSCVLDGAAKTVNLPASMTAADVGTQVTIMQDANLVGSGVLTINAHTGNTFSLNSFYSGMSGGAGLRIAATRPAAANNRLVITGAATNSAWGIGSMAVFTCVAAGEWHFAIRAEAIGNGSDAVAFSTV